jgi:hypothetical protein
MLIFVIQAVLPWLGRTDLHLKLGVSMAGYGVFVIVFGAWASIMLEVHRYSFIQDLNLSAMRLLINLETVFLFGGFFIGAIWYRKKPEIHKAADAPGNGCDAAAGGSAPLFRREGWYRSRDGSGTWPESGWSA